ncbi:ATP-binding cassette domain-containing protein [uncultured Paludibaculum sp.]|uniref:ABC transporter ATP-binding protein n=1 Tax=uncultured Paludibaculum sp. TaxID=1765020 RepID=UPI002AABE711|nr:ATP-binding cassette domain-containing protein [uncultured Paludibaculum sp.]
MLEGQDIVADNLGKVFSNGSESLTAIDSVSFTLARGRFLSIVGPSGCGKTTLLRMLAGLMEPTTGSVQLAPERVKAGVAYIPQSSMLLPWRTLLQNVALGLELKGPLSSSRVEKIVAEIHRYGLGGFENSLPNELSGGMAQRAAVVRALESRPHILFCDEPFSSIDFVTRLSLNTRFKYMCRVQTITTVFVTHNIEEAIFLGDEVAVMSGRPSRIVARYEPHLSIGSEDAVECRKSPEFSDLFVRIWRDLINGKEVN